VFLTIFVKFSGVKSQAGVSHKSLAKIIFSMVFNLSCINFLVSLVDKINIMSSFFSVLYCPNLYLDNRQEFIISIKLSLLFESNVSFSGNLGKFSQRNSINVLFQLLLKYII